MLCPGFGLFASKSLNKDSYIGIYFGEWLIWKEEKRMEIFNKIVNSSYLFNMKTAEFSVLDSARLGSETRFINHLPESIANCMVRDIKTHDG